ncbi:MAG: biotin/lipoyl-binding protein [Gammaproteobacteria bacterium]
MSAARVAISTNVPGRVVELRVHVNQRVHKGDLLFKLDERPFQLKVDEARAKLSNAILQIDALKATYRQKQSDLRSAETLSIMRSARANARRACFPRAFRRSRR